MRFFEEQTLKNLVYTAPFAAPLAYTGLGFLLLLDRMVDSRTVDWSRWVVFLALGGFVGNFVLTLADHAQNGFFHPSEWIGVVASAWAVSSLCAVLVVSDNPPLRRLALAIMAAQVGVGLLGFYLHAMADLRSPAGSLWDRFLYGAPLFAPLLFADLAMLAALGIWGLARTQSRSLPPATAMGKPPRECPAEGRRPGPVRPGRLMAGPPSHHCPGGRRGGRGSATPGEAGLRRRSGLPVRMVALRRPAKTRSRNASTRGPMPGDREARSPATTRVAVSNTLSQATASAGGVNPGSMVRKGLASSRHAANVSHASDESGSPNQKSPSARRRLARVRLASSKGNSIAP